VGLWWVYGECVDGVIAGVLWVWCGVSDEAQLKEVKEELVKVAVKKHESEGGV